MILECYYTKHFHDSYYLQRRTHLCLKNKPTKFKGAGTRTVFYSHTFIFMLSSNKVWEKRLISGLSQAGTAWLRKSSRYDSRDFWAGLGGPSTSSRLR